MRNPDDFLIFSGGIIIEWDEQRHWNVSDSGSWNWKPNPRFERKESICCWLWHMVVRALLEIHGDWSSWNLFEVQKRSGQVEKLAWAGDSWYQSCVSTGTCVGIHVHFVWSCELSLVCWDFWFGPTNHSFYSWVPSDWSCKRGWVTSWCWHGDRRGRRNARRIFGFRRINRVISSWDNKSFVSSVCCKTAVIFSEDSV